MKNSDYYNGKEFNGTYGSSKTEDTIYYYKGWYVVDGSVNVNRTHEELQEGVNVEELQDYDVFTAGKPINSLQELITAVED